MSNVNQLIKETKKYLRKYDYENVILNCNKILEIDPQSGFAIRFKGISYFQTGNYEKGLKYYQKLNKLYPNNNEILSTMAYLYEQLGNYEEAFNILEKHLLLNIQQ